MTADATDLEQPPGLFARARGILFAPQEEWRRIAREEPAPLLKGYVVPLAALGAVARMAGALIEQDFTLGASWSWLLISALLYVVLAVAGVVLLSAFANFFAARFGGERSGDRAKQLAAYAATPILVAGALAIVPLVAPLLMLAGLGYAGILFGMGARPLMSTPEERVAPYALSALGATALVAVVAVMLANPWLVRGREALAEVTPAIASPTARPAPPQQAQRSEVERALERMALEGARPAPLDPVRLQEQLPHTLPGGFTLSAAAGSAPQGLSQARGEYVSEDTRRLTVTLFHLGAVADARAAAAALDVEDAADGYVRRNSVDNRLYIERVHGDSMQYVVIGRGVAVRVDGSGVTVDRARAAVETIGVQRLEREFGA
jgi:hypothetical protein